jgi:hypothetical protein
MAFVKGHKGYKRKVDKQLEPTVGTVLPEPIIVEPIVTTTAPEIKVVMSEPEFPLNFIKVPKSAINWGRAYPVFNNGGSDYEKTIRQLYLDGYHLHSSVALSSTELMLIFEK